MHPPLTMHRYIATAILVAVAPFPPAIVGFSHPLASSSFFRHRIPFISSAARRDDVGAHAIDRHRQIESSPSSIPSRWGRKSSPYLAILTEFGTHFFEILDLSKHRVGVWVDLPKIVFFTGYFTGYCSNVFFCGVESHVRCFVLIMHNFCTHSPAF